MQDIEYVIQNTECRCKMQNTEYRIWNTGYRIQKNTESRIQRIQNAGYRVCNTKYRMQMQNAEYRI